MAQIREVFLYTPTSVPGCSLWLDGADSSTLTFSSGVNISNWRDKSGLSNNATANTAIAYNTSGLGSGYPALTFTNSQYLDGAISVTGPTMTVFSIFSMNDTSALAARVISLGAAGQNDFNNGGYVGILRQSSSNIGPFRNFTYTQVVTPYATRLMNTTYFDGTNQFTTTNGGTLLSNASSGSFAISTYRLANNLNLADPGTLNGFIGEVLVYNRSLIVSQRQQIEGYLAWKWGLQGNLPADHPYKTTRPLAGNPFPVVGIPPMPIQNQTVSVFLPTQISGCFLWLDAADPSTVSLSGTTIVSIQDKSPTQALFNQGSIKPTNTVLINGLTTMNFSGGSGSTNVLGTLTTTPYDNITQFSLFVVNRPTWASGTLSQSPCMVGIRSAATTTISWHNYSTYTTGYISWNGVSITTAPIAITQDELILFEVVQGASSYIPYKNGNASASVNYTITARTGLPASVGNSYVGQSEGFQGQIAEVVFFSRTLTTIERQQVEGYLAWKWGLVASLPNGHPYKRPPIAPFPFRSLPFNGSLTSWQPTQVPGLNLWLDAADVNSVVLTSGRVSQWTDKSGSGKNAIQTNASYRPSYGTSGIYRCISFTSANRHHLNGSPLLTSLSYSLFFVLNTFNPTPLQFVFFDYKKASGAGTGQNFVQFPISENSINAALIYQAEAPVTQKASNNVTIGTDRIQTGILDSPTNVSDNFYVNGNSIGSTYTNNGVANIATDTVGYTLGAIRVGATAILDLTLNGNIYEVIAYLNEVSKAQRQQTEGYLAWKWGLQGSLPATHPFKRWPPPPL